MDEIKLQQYVAHITYEKLEDTAKLVSQSMLEA